jgi:hypothetical protein
VVTYQYGTPSLIPVSEALISALELPVILWYFSHLKDESRLTLAQNPHFYEVLPKSSTKYGPKFRTQPTKNYQGTICVLKNNERRVFLELGQNQRTFDNIWRSNNAFILKGLCRVPFLAITDVFSDVVGKIEGEDIVGDSIPAISLSWSRKDPGLQFKQVGGIQDWREPIQYLWGFPRTHIHIWPSDPTH